jgi:Ca2+-transporting ATPase
VIGVLALISANRSWSRSIFRILRLPNRAYWWVVAGAPALLGTVIYVPSLSRIFRFTALHPNDLAICIGAGLVSALLIELVKLKRLRS